MSASSSFSPFGHGRSERLALRRMAEIWRATGIVPVAHLVADPDDPPTAGAPDGAAAPPARTAGAPPRGSAVVRLPGTVRPASLPPRQRGGTHPEAA